MYVKSDNSNASIYLNRHIHRVRGAVVVRKPWIPPVSRALRAVIIITYYAYNGYSTEGARKDGVYIYIRWNKKKIIEKCDRERSILYIFISTTFTFQEHLGTAGDDGPFPYFTFFFPAIGTCFLSRRVVIRMYIVQRNVKQNKHYFIVTVFGFFFFFLSPLAMYRFFHVYVCACDTTYGKKNIRFLYVYFSSLSDAPPSSNRRPPSDVGLRSQRIIRYIHTVRLALITPLPFFLAAAESMKTFLRWTDHQSTRTPP